MREGLREFTVVSQNKQSFALGIESANIEEPRKFRGQQIKDRISRVGICSGGNEARGFIEHDVERPFHANEFAPNFNMIVFGRLDAEISADASIDRDPAGSDQFIAAPARSDPGGSEKTI